MGRSRGVVQDRHLMYREAREEGSARGGYRGPGIAINSARKAENSSGYASLRRVHARVAYSEKMSCSGD